MWGRWQQGDSLRKISRLFDRHHSFCSMAFSCVPVRGPSAGSASLESIADARGAWGEFTRTGIGRIAALDCAESGAFSVDDQPRTHTQRRSSQLPSSRGRSGGLGPRRSDRSAVNCSCIAHLRVSWHRSCGFYGHRCRSRDGWRCAGTTRRVRCHTRQSIARCSCRPAGP